MSEQKSEGVQLPEGRASARPISLAPILGGIEITVTKRTGAQEKVKVRQLPIRMLSDWSNSLGDECALVELYCGKIDRQREAEQLKLSGEAIALYRKHQSGLSGKELEEVSNELAMTRAKITKLNSEPRWDDELTPESHDEIVRIGYELNRPRFDRWLADRHNAIGHLKETYRAHLPDHPLIAQQPATETASPDRTASPARTSSGLEASPPILQSPAEDPTPK